MTTPVTPAPDGSISVTATSQAKPAFLGLHLGTQDPTSSGVKGQCQGGIGVWGHTDSDQDQAAGVLCENASTHGAGVWGKGGQFAGRFDGDVQINGSTTMAGPLTVEANVEITRTLTVQGNDIVNQIGDLLSRVAFLEREVAQLMNHTHKYSVPDVGGIQDMPTVRAYCQGQAKDAFGQPDPNSHPPNLDHFNVRLLDTAPGTTDTGPKSADTGPPVFP